MLLTFHKLKNKNLLLLIPVAELVDVSCWSTTRDVLEIGSGPVPISMLSASRWSEWIVCSDFLERNRLKMSQWLTKQHDEEDRVWLPFSTFVHQLERPSSSLDELLFIIIIKKFVMEVYCDAFIRINYYILSIDRARCCWTESVVLFGPLCHATSS